MSPSSSPESFPLEGFEYALIDSGRFQKLERFGPYTFIRPAAQSIWPRRLADTEWKKADGEFRNHKGQSSGGGEWTFFSEVPKDGWPIRFQQIRFEIRPTSFGHLGIFPEQAINWPWIEECIRSRKDHEIQVLNIFGYTGASTLTAAAAGATVTHLDASKPSVTWARKNLELSGLGERPVRWIVDDAAKFLKREHKRGRRYNGIIMDPPSFGRGPKGEVWKLENQLADLMELCREVLSDDPLMVLLTTHSPGVSALALKNLILKFLAPLDSGSFQMGDMFLPDTGSGLHLPNGFYARWAAPARGEGAGQTRSLD